MGLSTVDTYVKEIKCIQWKQPVLTYFRLASPTLWLFNEKFSIKFDKSIIHYIHEAERDVQADELSRVLHKAVICYES